MTPSAGIPDQSLTSGLVGARLPTARVLPTLVSSSSSSEKLDYSRDDVTGIMCALLLTPASFHIWPKGRCRWLLRNRNCPLEGPLPLKVFFLFHSLLSRQPCRHCLNIRLDDILQRLPLLLKVTLPQILLKWLRNWPNQRAQKFLRYTEEIPASIVAVVGESSQTEYLQRVYHLQFLDLVRYKNFWYFPFLFSELSLIRS